MRKTCLTLALLILSTAHAMGQGRTPELPIDNVPYTPTPTQIAACGTKVGFDPRWQTTTVTDTDTRGRTWQGVKSTWNTDTAKAYFDHPIMQAVAPPLVSITAVCARADWPADAAEARVARVAKWARSKGYDHIKTRKHRIAGQTWHLVEYLTNEKGTRWFSMQTMLSLQGDVLHRVSLSAGNGCSGFTALLPSNQVHEVEIDGQLQRARFGDAKTLKNGVVCSQRRHGENVKLFQAVRRAMR